MEYNEYIDYLKDCIHIRITPSAFADVSTNTYEHPSFVSTSILEQIENYFKCQSYYPLLYTTEKDTKNDHFHLLLNKKQTECIKKYILSIGAKGNKSYSTSKVANPVKVVKYILKTPGWRCYGFSTNCVEIFKKLSNISYKNVKDIQVHVYALEDELMLLNITFHKFCHKYVDLCVQHNAQTRIMQLRRYFKFIKLRHKYVKYEKHNIAKETKMCTIGTSDYAVPVIIGDYNELRDIYINEALDY